MLRIFGLLTLFIVVSCSSQPTADANGSSCGSGDCVKNLNKLASPGPSIRPQKQKAH